MSVQSIRKSPEKGKNHLFVERDKYNGKKRNITWNTRRSSHWNARWEKRETGIRKRHNSISAWRELRTKDKNKKTTTIIIIFAARRNYGWKLCRTNKSQQIIECINNQWKKISITKHLLFKRELSFYARFFLPLCYALLYLHVGSTARSPACLPLGPFTTSVNTYLLPLQCRRDFI